MTKFDITLSLDTDQIDDIVVKALKSDMRTAHGCGDFKSFEAMFETLCWYEGHVNAFKYRMEVINGFD